DELQVDRYLIRVHGPWTSRLRFETWKKRFPTLDRLPLMGLAAAYSGLASRAAPRLSLAVSAAAPAVVWAWAWVRAHKAVAEVGYSELWARGPGWFGEATWRWPFWEHRHQRLVQRHPWKFRQDIRRVLRIAGGLGPGQRVLELGAGSGVVYEAVPKSWRK